MTRRWSDAAAGFGCVGGDHLCGRWCDGPVLLHPANLCMCVRVFVCVYAYVRAYVRCTCSCTHVRIWPNRTYVHVPVRTRMLLYMFHGPASVRTYRPTPLHQGRSCHTYQRILRFKKGMPPATVLPFRFTSRLIGRRFFPFVV